MFNFFRKKEDSLIEVTTKNLQHKKVITSSDIQDEMTAKLEWLLGSNEIELVSKEVDDFENQNKEILQKAKSLEKLGFTNTPSVKLSKDINSKTAEKKKEINLKQEEIELTKKYSLEFPMYKFVPERIFEEVRNNYDLYTAETSRYIKEIPTKNVSEIENFLPLAKPSFEVFLEMFSPYGSHVFSREVFFNEDDAKKHYNRLQEHRLPRCRAFLNQLPLFEITAPISHFDLSNTEIKNREIKTKIEVLDPIVTHKVKGGRIIVSVWDKEAEIPEIKNNILN